MVDAALGDLERLAELTGETVDELRHWNDLGLLNGKADAIAENVERVNLIRFAARRGITPEEVARVCADQGDMLGPFAGWVGEPELSKRYTRDEAAELCGLDAHLVDEVWSAAGLRDQTHATDQDLAALRMVATAVEFGLPTDVLLQLLRVLDDSLRRVADAATRAFHLHVHETFRSQGLRGAELMTATQSIADPLSGLMEPAVLYFHRKTWERANREDLLLHLMEESTAPGEFVRTMLFIDVSGYTPLTESIGDLAATNVVARFADIVRTVVAHHEGQIVKQIGDEFMVSFPNSAAAVAFGIEARRRTDEDESVPGVRIGAHCGPILYREGDYYGGTVNLAARVTSAALAMSSS